MNKNRWAGRLTQLTSFRAIRFLPVILYIIKSYVILLFTEINRNLHKFQLFSQSLVNLQHSQSLLQQTSPQRMIDFSADLLHRINEAAKGEGMRVKILSFALIFLFVFAYCESPFEPEPPEEPPLPVIEYFTADQTQISSGESAALSRSTTNTEPIIKEKKVS